MSELTTADIVAELSNESFAFEPVLPGSVLAQLVPVQWLPILGSTDARERIELALSLWQPDLLVLFPKFAVEFRKRLTDVLVFSQRAIYREQAEVVLVYATGRDSSDDPVVWVGWDPASFGEKEPRFFDTIPEPVREFLRTTHAGFNSDDGEGYGFKRPRYIMTLSEYGGWSQDEPGFESYFDDDTVIDSSRLLWITRNAGEMYYCTSPDIPKGTVTILYEGFLDDPTDFMETIDELMSERWDIP